MSLSLSPIQSTLEDARKELQLLTAVPVAKSDAKETRLVTITLNVFETAPVELHLSDIVLGACVRACVRA